MSHMSRRALRHAAVCLAVLMCVEAPLVLAGERPLLELEKKIPLGKVSGRLDHLAIDVDRRRLFLAELGNNSVSVIDINAGMLAGRLEGFKKPQGVAYVKSTDTLYVSNAGNGALQLFQGADLAPSGRIELADDADNIRVDKAADKVFVGYGRGGIAIIDPSNRAKIADVALIAHPEGFHLSGSGGRVFVNLPDVQQIAVVDVREGKVSASWAINDAHANFPMAIDEDGQRVLVVFRSPARLEAFAMRDGSLVAKADTCGDADDVFADAKRHRVYISCGEGFIDVFESRDGRYDRSEHIATASGARTSLFVPELDRLFLAVRATWSEPAAIWVFRPTP
ncbi:MAG: hypothetical protein NVSMB26_19770 [Beijerinckiaceae bacterium]